MRIGDNLTTARAGNALTWAYNHGNPHPSTWMRHDDPGAMARYVDAAGKIMAARAIDATNVAEYFCKAIGDAAHDIRSLVPNLTPPCARLFVDVDAADVEAPFPLPPRWAWLFETAKPAQVMPMFEARGVPPAGGFAFAMVANLALGWRGSDGITLPAATVVAQCAADGRILDAPMFGFPYEVDEALFYSHESAVALVAYLYQPAAFAICLMTSPDVTASPAKVKKSKSKKPSERPAIAYEKLDIDDIVDALRMEGMAGIVGLPEAMAKCQYRFPPRFAPATSRILDPSGNPFRTPARSRA